MKAMETLQDLIEEAKLRTVWWALCIFAVSYFLTHTSKSMWMNVPMAVLLVSGLRLLLNEVEFSWKIRKQRPLSYLSHLEKKKLSVNDSRLSTSQPPPKWKRKIDSPTVEAAMQDFINKVLQDFVVDLWYTDITPDKEAPQLINAVIMDVLGEISARVKEINLVDLLTRDVVDLVGDHIELFRRNNIAIGVDVMGMLSSEERDERLKHHLMASKDIHPALISPDCEYKVLQRIMGGVLAILLKPREAQCPLVRCIAREILTCLIMQPVMDFACPEYINELLECIFLATMNEPVKEVGDDHTAASDFVRSNDSPSVRDESSYGQRGDMSLSRLSDQREVSSDPWGNIFSGQTQDDQMHHRPADWARILEAATQRRTEVLMPENLENMWAKGRNYKKNIQKNAARGLQTPITKGLGTTVTPTNDLKRETPASMEDQSSAQTPVKTSPDALLRDQNLDAPLLSDLRDGSIMDGGATADELGLNSSLIRSRSKNRLKRSNSTSDLKVQTQIETSYPSEVNGPIITEYYSATVSRSNEVHNVRSVSDKVLRIEGHIPKLKCRVLGAYFEKLGSKSFAVYSIAVTDADNKTWFVKRRYRNFERLHRLLKDIPNYTLHLPPKRIFSSSTEDAFVHQRCIQLDKYLRDLLSIANVAEQHEVWDFLSVSSKNYSFGKSSSVMRTLAVNVDDAVDDIVRQFKGVSDGLMRKVVGPSSSSYEASSVPGRNLSWKSDEMNNMALGQAMLESANSYSDNEVGDKDGNHDHDAMDSTAQANGWHSDNELNSKSFPPRVVKHDELLRGLGSEKKIGSGVRSEILSLAANFPAVSDQLEDPLGVPAEDPWIAAGLLMAVDTPPNVSVPLLNLVDKIFQLERRGWLRRQVFWISKQILQLMMEDAIDDWLVGQIHWLRREDTVALGIRWIQDLLWPGGTFFRRLNTQHEVDASQTNQISPESSVHSAGSKVTKQGSFEQQLEAARRASEVKKMIFDGAPSSLVSLIGHKQYKHCARDIYYFLQSTICLKQLAYTLLELVLITVLPELRDVIADVHERMPTQSV